MMNGIDTIIQRLNTDAKAETDALLEKARQEAAAVAARYQAQADKEAAQDRETVGQAAVDAANGKSGGKLTLSGETAPIQGGFILKDGNVEVNCAFDTLVRLQKAETAGQVAQRLFG